MKHKLRNIVFTVCAAFGFFTLLAGFSYAQDVFPEGSLWRAEGDYDIFAISNGYKRHVPNVEIFNSYGFNWSDVKNTDTDTLSSIPDVRVIKTVDSLAVYELVDGKRVGIESEDDFVSGGFSWDEIVVVDQTEMDFYPPKKDGESEVLESPPSQEKYSSLLLQKIDEAKNILSKAAPVYPQQYKKTTTIRSLSKGVSGEDVRVVQKKLQELGFFPASVFANGNFGPTTESSVKKFQKANGIIQNGVVGPQTRTALSKKGLNLTSGTTVLNAWKDTVPEDREVLIVAWNQSTDDMKVIHIDLQTHKVWVGSVLRSTTKAVSKTPGYVVHYKSGNGVNTQYTISSPAGYQVLANRFPIFDEASGKLGTFPPVEVVYVPYADALRTPEIVAEGRLYLDTVVKSALEDLRKKQVQSATGKGLVADITDPNDLKNIAIIEHIDPTEFRNTDDKQGVINKVFTVLGTNKEMAYRFSGSSKGALGLAQFIESTYNSIYKQYFQARLLADFEAGMNNHVNAFQAMSLYQDVSGGTLEGLVQKVITKNPVDLAWVMAEVRAAAYNGGAGRVKKALTAFGAQWDSAVSSLYGLRAETKSYLDKFRNVRQILRTL